MSNEKQETIADIIEGKRREAQHIRENNDTLIGRKDALKLEEEADRIEAAHKREVADLRERIKIAEDALGESRIAICHICDMKHTCGNGTAKFDPCCIIKDIDSAIAAIRGEGCAK